MNPSPHAHVNIWWLKTTLKVAILPSSIVVDAAPCHVKCTIGNDTTTLCSSSVAKDVDALSYDSSMCSCMFIDVQFVDKDTPSLTRSNKQDMVIKSPQSK